MTMLDYLNERGSAERTFFDDLADLGKRCDAIAVLLQHPISDGLRKDLRRQYLVWTDILQARESVSC